GERGVGMRRTLTSVLSTSLVGLTLFACGSDGEPAANPRTTDEPSAPGVDPTTDVSPSNSQPNDSTAPVGPDGPVAPDPGVNPDPGLSPVAPKPSEAHPPTLAACEAPAVGSPTLRLLTRFEFQ